MKATSTKIRSTRSSRPTKAWRATPPRQAKADDVIDLIPALLKIKSILVPIDFSDTAKKALRYAERLAQQFGAKITLLHVIEPVAALDVAYHPLMLETAEVKESARKRVDGLARQMRLSPKLLERTLVRYGSPFAEITEAARTLKVDLIVVSTHGYTGLKHVLLGSTAERVVRHAPCPVLTVREKQHEFA